MIPGLLASEVSAALREFIVTGFETETAPFKGGPVITRILHDNLMSVIVQ